ncbi:RNA polymerase sigma factor [Woodsholea maritima]|uniref:RNA polymerase sigma factor n=1 Tax=Woodsholea maritima TaxID=240237 RepID=UPI00039A7177|nr:sigma-70 family RNA polymerase sigma factor [Woodsholea maritima]
MLVKVASDQAAFSQLVRRYQAIVRGLLMRLCANHAEADDLAQDTFIKAHEKLASYQGDNRFKGWICKIAYTEFLQSARKRKSRARLLERYRAEQDDEAQPVSETAGMSQDLDRALGELKGDERICVVMCYACSMSHGDIVEATGLPLGTVKSHINRGRAKLKAYFAPKEVAA